jgi:hypothetical protein
MRNTCIGVGVVSFLVVASGCGGGGGGGGGFSGGTPAITSVNGSTSPTTPVNVAIEVDGTNFGPSPGSVKFVQGATTLTVVPAASAWSNTSIIVDVPTGLAAPGSASVSVLTSTGATSNAVNVNLVVAPSFSPSNQTWVTSTALPAALRGHQAVSVLSSSSTAAYVYVIGGNNGTANQSTVSLATVTNAGAVSAWSAAASLPAARAFAAVAEADPTNASVANGTAYIYAIGGQAAAADAPGGTNTVFVGTVTLATGAVSWATNSTTLPETRLGAKAVVSNGFLYVTGGLGANGNPIAFAASAPINANGTVGNFTEAASAYLLGGGIAFHETFAFGGFLYVVGGDLTASMNPYAATLPSGATTQFATIRQGVIGTWSATSGQPSKARSKFALLFSFGQLAILEGLYNGGVGSSEGQISSVTATGDLSSFNGLNGSNSPGLNTFNLAAVSTPLVTTGAPTKPVWLLIGGDNPAAPGTPVSTVKQGP